MIDLDKEGFEFDEKFGVWHQANAPEFKYTDGEDIENKLFSIVSNAEDITLFSPELRAHCTDWVSHYHLHPTRSNIARPFEKYLRGSVLEIGAGCGAVTRFLGEIGGQVVAIEGSRNRACIAASRTRDLDNVKVLNCDFNNLNFQDKFDAVLIIGVLEYAAMFSKSDNPYVDVLIKARNSLTKNGIVVIAIENQLGIKYFAGSPEDHMNQKMFGIQDFYKLGGVRTFGFRELDKIIKSSGLLQTHYSFPFPDYKFPKVILRQRYLNPESKFDAATLIRQTISGDMQVSPSEMHFSIEASCEVLQRNGLISDLSNSFLVIASNDYGMVEGFGEDNIMAEYYSTNRQKSFCKSTVFTSQESGITVSTHDLYPGVESRYVDKEFSHINTGEVRDYVCGSLLSIEFQNIVSRKGWLLSDVVTILKEQLSFVYRTATGAAQISNFHLGDLIPGEFIDATPINIIRGAQGLVLIDQEWRRNSTISLSYLLFRSISVLFRSSSFIAMPADEICFDQISTHTAIFESFDYSLSVDEIETFLMIEARFMSFALGYAIDPIPFQDWAKFCYPYAEDNHSAAIRSLREYASSLQDLADRYMAQIRWLEGENNRRATQEEAMTGEIQHLKSSLYDESVANQRSRDILKNENTKLKLMLANYLISDASEK